MPSATLDRINRSVMKRVHHHRRRRNLDEDVAAALRTLADVHEVDAHAHDMIQRHECEASVLEKDIADQDANVAELKRIVDDRSAALGSLERVARRLEEETEGLKDTTAKTRRDLERASRALSAAMVRWRDCSAQLREVAERGDQMRSDIACLMSHRCDVERELTRDASAGRRRAEVLESGPDADGGLTVAEFAGMVRELASRVADAPDSNPRAVRMARHAMGLAETVFVEMTIEGGPEPAVPRPTDTTCVVCSFDIAESPFVVQFPCGHSPCLMCACKLASIPNATCMLCRGPLHPTRVCLAATT